MIVYDSIRFTYVHSIMAKKKEELMDGQNDVPEMLTWTPELVEKFWDGFSKTRLVEMSFSLLAGRSLIIAVDHLLPPDGRILDYGAGNGHLIKLMSDRNLQAAAYEPSKSRAQDLISSLESAPGFIGVIDENAQDSFDVIIMAEVIEHILDDNLDASLKRVASLTEPGGTLIVTTPNNEDLDLGMSYCPVSNVLFHRWQHMRSFNKESLPDLLSKYGFDEVATHQVAFDEEYYVPTDPIWGGTEKGTDLPSYIKELRQNRPVWIGAGNNLLYIGRRR